MDLAGPLGLDLGLDRALGLGAVSLRPLGDLRLALVLGARGPTVRVVAYSPALVAFVGGTGGGYVGWFPLAPRDPFVPGGAAANVNVNVTNVTYVNRTYVTVVNQNTFVSGRVVTNNYVRDRDVSRVERAPVVRGPIPSCRPATRSG